MLKIENIEVVGWKHAVRGMRNPYGMNSVLFLRIWRMGGADYQ